MENSELDEIQAQKKDTKGRIVLTSISEKVGYDEMQVQKRDSISRRVFTASSWAMFLVAGLSIHPRIDSSIMRWLLEPLHMAFTIVGIFIVAVLVNFICLTKAGALVPFRMKKGTYAAFGIGGFATGLFFMDTIYSFGFAAAIWTIVLTVYFLKKRRDKKKKVEEACESDMHSQQGEIPNSEKRE